MTTTPLHSQTRRDFLNLSSSFGTAATIGSTPLMAQAAAAGPKPLAVVRVGFVGVGVKGTEHLANLLSLPGVELRAVCDIKEDACTRAQGLAEKAGQMLMLFTLSIFAQHALAAEPVWPINLAAAPVDTSGFAAEHPPGLMFVGDAATRYVSTGPADWIRVDLGQEYFLNQVEIRFSPSCATAMTVSVLGAAGEWNKNENYSPVWSIGPVSSGSYLSSTDNGKDYADPTVLNVNFRTQSVSANASNHAALHQSTVTPAVA